MSSRHNNGSKNLEGLYSTPDDVAGGTASGLRSRLPHSGEVSGYISPEEQNYYRRKAQFFSFMKWAIGIAIGVAVTLILFYMQSIYGPLSQLEVKTDENSKDIQSLNETVRGLVIDRAKDQVINNASTR